MKKQLLIISGLLFALSSICLEKSTETLSPVQKEEAVIKNFRPQLIYERPTKKELVDQLQALEEKERILNTQLANIRSERSRCIEILHVSESLSTIAR